MSEEPRSNPLESLIADKFVLPNIDDLSDEQRQALLEGPGWVDEPVTMRRFHDVESFSAGPEPIEFSANNFPAYFNRNGVLAYGTEHMPAFQRFKILYPDVVDYMDREMAACSGQPTQIEWRDLLRVYEVMAALVDRKDPNVIRDGKVDDLILTR